MAKRSTTRKQLLKEPDQFISFSGKLIAFGRSHLKPMLISAGCIIVLLLAVATVRQIADQNEDRASQLVQAAVAKYSSSLQESNSEAAYDRVKEDFLDIFDRYGSKNAAKAGRIIYANISYTAGDADTAIAMYKTALKDFDQSPALKNIVLSGLGHAHLLKREFPQSIQYFERISINEETTLKSGALFNLAWLYDATGEPQKSIATYEKLLAEFPDTIYGELVREKLNG